MFQCYGLDTIFSASKLITNLNCVFTLYISQKNDKNDHLIINYSKNSFTRTKLTKVVPPSSAGNLLNSRSL